LTQRLVLVVDDDDDVREITCLALEAVGQWAYVDADRGTKAVEVAIAERPDVILLDVMMPGMDGIETAQVLWADERTRGIPVILLTAKVQVTESWTDVPGVVGAVVKPFDPFGLVAEIDRILDARDGETVSRG
jgi:two-component system alkaline phosphatase synthesis response regulator PhoP